MHSCFISVWIIFIVSLHEAVDFMLHVSEIMTLDNNTRNL